MKFANLKPAGSIADSSSLSKDLHWILRNALRNPDSLCVASDLRDTPVTGLSQHGLHHHDDWELFCTMRGSLRFEVAGCPPATFARGSVLVVPPGCLHSASILTQPEDLRVLVIHIPNSTGECGAIDLSGNSAGLYSALSVGQFAKWTELLGETPGSIMGKAVRVAAGDEWGREHALGLVRVLLSTYAEMSTSSRNRNESGGQRVSDALFFLHSNYYEASLSLPQVAAAAGLSVSRLSGLFRKTTGHSVRQTLIDIRLRRAMTLIKQSRYSIKEIAHMTGWSNQLYFSAAFRKCYVCPPSSFRNAKMK
ncbi:MAG: AraC family transcriptional regulator [Victivallales bacterium]|jgi:AraC-like DNA-binding protein